MKRKLSALLIVLTLLFSNAGLVNPVFADDIVEVTQDLNSKISQLPETMLTSENVAKTFQQLLDIQEKYNKLSDEEKESVTNYSKVEKLLNPNDDSLNTEFVSQKTSSLKGKTIGYLGSSITVGFRSENVAFPDYIGKITGSTTVKQAITGGPLAKKEGVRDEVSYITQMEDNLTKNENLDALVVQLSTNDTTLGIEMGEVSSSQNKDDYDYSTVIGAMEYIIAYAKEKWNCPVIFYINPYLSDEVIEKFAKENNANIDEIKEAYQNTYEKMIDALYKVQNKWNIGVIDMWNNDAFKNIDIDLRSNYYMADIIHPTKAGYLFWYTPYIQAQLEKELENKSTDEKEHTVTLTQASHNRYDYNALEDGYTTDYSSIMSPQYYVYAGNVNKEEAETLLDQMKIADNLHEWAATIHVITPLNNDQYTQKDADSFIDLLGTGSSNVKVIGIDDGATFVNNYISQECYAVADIMTYGGTMDEGHDYNVPVPAYLSQPCQEAVNYYVKANQAEKGKDNVYFNKENELQRVVVGYNESLAEAFENAWEEVFSKNYRQHNEKTEFYMASAKQYTDPYLLINIPNFKELKINYNPHYNESLNGEGQYTWFEYIPQSTLKMENGSVPLVVSLHGNGNDARLQGETTGWPELAAKENFMVVAPEWQDVVLDSSTHEPGPNFFNCDGLEGDKLIEWIEMLEQKYPQIDASRIYVTGLSAGGSASTLYGAKYSKVFAGVGAVSAPGVDKDELTELVKTYNGGEVPYLYLCGDHDFFGMIPVDLSSKNAFEVAPGVYLPSVDSNVDMFPFIQAYQKINHLTVSEKYDMSLNEYYGIRLDNEQWIKLGVKDTLEGTLSNENGVIMKFAAIKDQAHWNYKPEAQYMWNFFKNYQRDIQTGELIRVDKNNNDKNDDKTNTSTKKPENVKTGDENNILLFGCLALITGGVIVYIKKKEMN